MISDANNTTGSVRNPGKFEVSVIVINWNRGELLRACLRSLMEQTAGFPFEIIVVDNGSTDGSVEMIAREFSAGLQSGAVKLICNHANLGFCAANNIGIRAAEGKFIALLNNDAEASGGWLAALREVFERGADIGMAASKILVYEQPEIIDKAGHLIYPDGQNRGRGTGERDRGQYDRVEEVLWPDGCAAMYRRAMLDQIGGFDEDFFAYGDDAELGLRARIAGWRCVYTPDAVVRHHRGATLGQLSGRRLQLIERNRVLLATKLFPWSLLCLNGPYYAARLAAGAWAALRRRGEVGKHTGWKGKLRAAWALIRGDLAALRLIPAMLKKRRQMAKLRRLSDTEIKSLLRKYRIPLKQLSELAT